MNAQEKIAQAQKLLAERGPGWFSAFLWDNTYALQCGKYLLMLDEGATNQGEPPWVYATGNSDYHDSHLADEGPLPFNDPEGWVEIFIDFRESNTGEWVLRQDRFIDEDEYEYAVVDANTSKRVTDLPAAIIEYAGGIVARPQKQ